MSRIASRYSLDSRRSPGAEPLLQPRDSPVTESRMLRFFRSCGAPLRAVPPSPNSRSNTTRGLVSIGSGVVGVATTACSCRRSCSRSSQLPTSVVQVGRQLERRQRACRCRSLRGDLIDGRAGADSRRLRSSSGGLRSASDGSRAHGLRRRPIRVAACWPGPLSTMSWSRNGASGCRIGESSNCSAFAGRRPAVGMIAPFGM